MKLVLNIIFLSRIRSKQVWIESTPISDPSCTGAYSIIVFHSYFLENPNNFTKGI